MNKATLILMTLFLIQAAPVLNLETASAESEFKRECAEGAEGRECRGRHKDFLKNLNLNKEQKANVKAIREANKAIVFSKREVVRSARDSLREAMQGDATDEQLRVLFGRVQDAKNDLKKTRLEVMLSIRQVLTPEQRKQFKGLPHRRGWRQRGHENRPGGE